MSNKSNKHTDKPHPSPDKNERDQYKRHVEGSITVRGQVETHLPPELVKKHDTEREQDAATGKKKFRVEILTLIVLAIYTGFTFWQGLLTRQSINNASAHFRQEQRAWISVSVDPSIPAQNDVQIFWPLHINNVGKSFANNIEGDFFATVFKKGESPQFDYSVGHPHRRINVGGIFPNEPLPQTSIRVERYGPHVPEPVLMTQELRQAITNNEQAIVVYGRITYRDIFGVNHWTQFCNGTGDALQFDAIKKCIDYNDADNNY